MTDIDLWLKNSELPPEHIAMMLTSTRISIEKRLELAREQIAVRECAIAHLKAWVELNDKENKE